MTPNIKTKKFFAIFGVISSLLSFYLYSQPYLSKISAVEPDTTPPVITIDSYSEEFTNQDLIVTASVDEGNLSATSHTFSENGSFDFVAVDAFGNTSTTTVTIGNIDKTPPSTIGNITVTPTSPTIEKIVNWAWESANTDISGLRQYAFEVWKGTQMVFSDASINNDATIDLTEFGDGAYTFKISAEDNATNIGPVSSSSVFIIDTTSPSTPTAYPPSGDYQSVQLIELSSIDNGSGVKSIYYTLDGTIPDNSKSLYTGKLTIDKDTVIKAIAYDHLLHQSEVLTATYSIAPQISQQTTSLITENSATISWTTNSPATSRVVWDRISHSPSGIAPNYGYSNSTVETDNAPMVTSHLVTLTSLEKNTTYYYRTISHGSPENFSEEQSFTTSKKNGSQGDEHRSETAAINSNNNNVPVCHDPPPARPPRLLSATAGNNSVTLTWSDDSNNVSYYLVTYGNLSGLQQYGNPNVGPAGTTSYTINSLSGSQRYYFKVRAGNGCTPGDFSNELSSQPLGQFIANPPAGFEAGILGVQTSVVDEITPTQTPSVNTESAVLGTSTTQVRTFDRRFLWALILIPIVGGYYFRYSKK